MQRKARGIDLPADVDDDRVTLAYRGLDDVVRRTTLRFAPRPSQLSRSEAHLDLMLRPQEESGYTLTVACEGGGAIPRVLGFDEARLESQASAERYSAWSCHLHTPNGQVNAWIDRAVLDLQMMTTDFERAFWCDPARGRFFIPWPARRKPGPPPPSSCSSKPAPVWRSAVSIGISITPVLSCPPRSAN